MPVPPLLAEAIATALAEHLDAYSERVENRSAAVAA